jgi:Ca-activated chloride channel homolog
MQIESKFTYEKVRHDQANDVHLVVTLKAPKIDWQSRRPPVCITVALDVSGSMQGQKLDYAKKSVTKLVDHLQPGDYCGMVVFSTDVRTVFPPVEITQYKKEELRSAIGKLVDEQSTNFSGGMLQALELANKTDLPINCLNRVIMFTDGLANCGVATKAEAILKLLESNLGRATVSAFGFGMDANQELLTSLARIGKGNYAFVQNPDDALSAFAKELGGLLSTYAQNIEIRVSPHNGHRIQEVVSDVDTQQDGNDVIIKLPDILSEEERHLVLAFKLTEQSQALPRAMNVADIKVGYEWLDEQSKKTKKTEELKAKIQFVKSGEEQTKATEDVDKIVGLAQLVQKQAEALEHTSRGDFAGASAVMSFAGADFERRGLMPQASAARGMRHKMGSASAVSANAGYFASMKSAGARAYATSGSDREAELQLQGMGVAMSNSAQDAQVASFTGDPINQAAPVTGVPIAPVAVPPPTDAKPMEKKEKPKGLSKKRSSARW